jgi:hypothetical protein
MNTRINNRPSFWVILAFVAVLALTIASPSFAQGVVTGTATVTGGTLDLVAEDDPTFLETTLNGTDQTQTDSIAMSVNDFTGSGDGWNLQITSTAFSDGSHALANTAMTITGVGAVCDGGDCTLPTGNEIVYPFTVPADTVAPAAGKFFNAEIGSGMGDFTVTPAFQLAIPANTYAGAYESTVTITLATAP